MIDRKTYKLMHQRAIRKGIDLSLIPYCRKCGDWHNPLIILD